MFRAKTPALTTKLPFPCLKHFCSVPHHWEFSLTSTYDLAPGFSCCHSTQLRTNVQSSVISTPGIYHTNHLLCLCLILSYLQRSLKWRGMTLTWKLSMMHMQASPINTHIHAIWEAEVAWRRWKWATGSVNSSSTTYSNNSLLLARLSV